MNRALVATIIAVVVVLAVTGILYFSSSKEVISENPPVQGETYVPDKPIPAELQGKTVRTEAVVTRQFFEPSSITVGRNDIVNLYVTSLDDGIVLYTSNDGTRTIFDKASTQLIAMKAEQELTLSCVEGCEPGVVLTVKVQ